MPRKCQNLPDPSRTTDSIFGLWVKKKWFQKLVERLYEFLTNYWMPPTLLFNSVALRMSAQTPGLRRKFWARSAKSPLLQQGRSFLALLGNLSQNLRTIFHHFSFLYRNRRPLVITSAHSLKKQKK